MFSPPNSPTPELVRKQLDKIARSATFGKPTRPKQVLRFLVTEMLAGREDNLAGKIIAEKFYNSNNEAMRAEAGRIRERLEKYYLSDGKLDPILIEIPKRGYVPEFSWLDASTPGGAKQVNAPLNEVGKARGRRQMLARVRHDWIETVLDQSLYRLARLDLGLEDRPDAVENPLTLLVQEADRPARPLLPGTPISAAFDDQGGALLILGAPGSGKTTLLLELAHDLLDRAEQDEDHEIPVVFNLSSWAVERRPLTEWLVEELNGRYDVPRKVAKHWVDTEQLTPLLDGLDEVGAEHREGCVKAVNEFRSQHGFVPLAVCGRTADYEALTHRLRLQGGVLIQPLRKIEVQEYIRQAGDSLIKLRRAVDSDPTLWEVLDTPLLLSVAMLAYANSDAEILPMPGSLEERRRDLFAKYIETMLQRRAKVTRYTDADAVHWLSWLALTLLREQQSVFYLESLRPEWLQSYSQQRLGSRAVSIFSALGAGMLLGLSCRSSVAFVVGTVAIALMFPPHTMRLRTLRSFEFRWSPELFLCIVLAELTFGVGFGIFGHPYIGLVGGLTVGYWLWVAKKSVFAWALPDSVKDPIDLTIRRYPNEGTRRSAVNSVFLVFTWGLFGWLLPRVYHPFSATLDHFFGVLSGIILGLIFGGLFCLLHVVTRVLLWWNHDGPLRYVRFLDWCAERLFLRKVGGGYVFVHRLLAEYFASLHHLAPQAKGQTKRWW